MNNPGTNVTSAIYYMNKESTLQKMPGLPDKEKLQMMIGVG